MAKLIREIEPADIPQLKELMTLVFNDSEWKDIQRLGGDYSGPFGAICPDFESHHSGE